MRNPWLLRCVCGSLACLGVFSLLAASPLALDNADEPNAFMGLRLPMFGARAMPVEAASLLPATPARTHAIHIPLLKERRHGLHVSMRLNNQVNAPFLVDTGATYTVISPRLAQKLGIIVPENGPTIMLATANGLASAPIVQIDRLSVKGYEMRNLQAVIRELGDSHLEFDGLLGLNFFQDLEFSVKKDRLELSVAG